LTHHLIAEAELGRPIARDETVRFRDGDRANLSPDNIYVTQRKTSLRGKLAALEARKMELEAEIDHVKALLAKQNRTEK
jgi:hypothetical protein